MGKQAKQSRKYGAPLYAVAWPQGDLVFFAGGGGKKSSGIKNRVVAARARGESLSDEVAALELEDCPIRMAAHPSGQALVLALGSGGLARVNVARGDGDAATSLSLASGEEADVLGQQPVAKCLAFSSDGRLLALGGEDGSLTVLEWPTLRTRASLTGAKGLPDGLRDVDFSGGHQQRVVAATCEDGSCSLWDWERGLQLLKLALPEGMSRGSFNRARWARDGSLGLYTAVNAAGIGYILHWEQNQEGDVVLKRKVKAVPSAITAFDIGPTGRTLALGTSEGEVHAWSTETLSRRRRERQAHMVFATAVAVPPEDSALASVSADASACVLTVQQRRRRPGGGWLVPLLVLLLAAIVYYVMHVRGMDLRWQSVRRLLQELRDPYSPTVTEAAGTDA